MYITLTVVNFIEMNVLTQSCSIPYSPLYPRNVKEANVWRYNFQKFGVATAHGQNETSINHFVLYWLICCEIFVLANACGHVEFSKKGDKYRENRLFSWIRIGSDSIQCYAKTWIRQHFCIHKHRVPST